MAVPSTFSELSTTPGSNSGLISNATAVGLIDDHMQWAYAALASIQANSGNGWTSPYLPAANPVYTGTLTGGTGVLNLGSGQFYKDASGNVGIGTGAPGFKLHVNVTTDGTVARFRQTGGTNQPYFNINTTEATGITTLDANAATGAYGLAISTGSAERMRIDAAGNVGVGTASPSARLHVNGSVRLDAATTTSATAGGASALPALPAGYLTVNIGGTDYKLPYFAA